MKRREITEAAAIAALYVVLVWLLAPFSFGVLQFRVAEMLKPLVLKGKRFAYGLSLGLLLANVASPNAGLWELVLMPAACLCGGLVAWRLRRWPILALTAYCGWVSAAVSTMLSALLVLPIVVIFPGIVASEGILFAMGWGLSETVFRRADKGRSSGA